MKKVSVNPAEMRKRTNINRARQSNSETIPYQGSLDILANPDGSFISPARCGDIENGCIGVWTPQGYHVKQSEIEQNPWIEDMLNAHGCILAA